MLYDGIVIGVSFFHDNNMIAKQNRYYALLLSVSTYNSIIIIMCEVGNSVNAVTDPAAQ